MEESKEIKEAVEKLDSLSEDERMQRIADLREKAILDEKAIYAKGLDDGIKEGLEKGKQKEKLEIAKKLKKRRNEYRINSRNNRIKNKRNSRNINSKTLTNRNFYGININIF